MKIVFWVSAVLVVLTLAASALYWSVYAGTGEDAARKRAVGFFRWAVVVVLGNFNIWIFTRIIGTLISMWFPGTAPPPPPQPELIDGQLPGRRRPKTPNRRTRAGSTGTGSAPETAGCARAPARHSVRGRPRAPSS